MMDPQMAVSGVGPRSVPSERKSRSRSRKSRIKRHGKPSARRPTPPPPPPAMVESSESSPSTPTSTKSSVVSADGGAALPLMRQQQQQYQQQQQHYQQQYQQQQKPLHHSPSSQPRPVTPVQLLSPGAASTGSSSSLNDSNHSRSRIKRYGSASRSPSRESGRRRSTGSPSRSRSRSRTRGHNDGGGRSSGGDGERATSHSRSRAETAPLNTAGRGRQRRIVRTGSRSSERKPRTSMHRPAYRSNQNNPATSSSDDDTAMTHSVDDEIDHSGDYDIVNLAPRRSSSTPKYEKYRSFLTRGLSESGEWIDSDTKLGAPPSLDADGNETDGTAPLSSSDDHSRRARAPIFGGASELGGAANVVSANASDREGSRSGRSTSDSKRSKSAERRSISLPQSSVLDADDMATLSMMLTMDDDDESQQSASVSARISKHSSSLQAAPQAPQPPPPPPPPPPPLEEDPSQNRQPFSSMDKIPSEDRSSDDDESILNRKKAVEQRSTIDIHDEKSLQLMSVAGSINYSGFISEDEDDEEDEIPVALAARHRMFMHNSLGSLGYSSESNHPSAPASSSQLLAGTHIVDEVDETAKRLQTALHKVQAENESYSSPSVVNTRAQRRRTSNAATAASMAAGFSMYTSSTSGSYEDEEATDYSASEAGSARLAAVAASIGSLAPIESDGATTEEDTPIGYHQYEHSNRMPDVSSDGSGSDNDSGSSSFFSNVWKQSGAPDVMSISRKSSTESTQSSLASRNETARMSEAAALAALAAVKSGSVAETARAPASRQRPQHTVLSAASVPFAPDPESRRQMGGRAAASPSSKSQAPPDAYHESDTSFDVSIQGEKEMSLNILDIGGGAGRAAEEDMDIFSLGASMDVENFGRYHQDLPEYNRNRMGRIGEDIEEGDNSMSLTAMLGPGNNPQNDTGRSERLSDEMEPFLDTTLSLELADDSESSGNSENSSRKSENLGNSKNSGKKPPSKQSSKSKRRKKREDVSIVKTPSIYSGVRRSIIRGAVLFFALAIIIVSVIYILRDDDGTRKFDEPLFPPVPTPPMALVPVEVGPPSFTPTISPAPSPSPIPLPLQQRLIAVWPPLEQSFQDPQSPQSLALAWMESSDNVEVESLPVFRIIQRFVMATFYYSTNGDNWTVNTLWLSRSNECTWYSGSIDGPACNGDGQLINLELVLNNVGGNIPSELALLSDQLLSIDLSRAGSPASVGGFIPSELGLLTKLELLALQGNGMSGSLPSELGNCQMLELVDLSENQLVGELPESLGQLTELEEFDLKSNKFAGTLPTTMGTMKSLRRLDFSSNEFAGPIPSEIGDIFVLEFLDMSNNKLTSLPSEIGRMLLLRNINLSNNAIGGNLVPEIGMLSNVLSLDLSSNNLSGPLPTQLGDMFLLRDVLDLSSNQLTGTIPLQLARLIFIRNIRLQSNRFSGPVPSIFNGLTRLNSLRLEDNDLTGAISESVCELFQVTYPLFVADCSSEIDCPCCSYCCDDTSGICTCEFQGTDLDFLCIEGDQFEQ